MDREGDEGAHAPRPGEGSRDVSGPALDFDLDAQIDDLAAELQFDDTELGDELGDDLGDELGDDADIEELDPDIEELADALPDIPEPQRLYLELDGRIHVVETDRFVIGRVSGQSDLAIIDANVSRQHCAIERRDGEFFVKDLGSTNGIEIDGHRVDDHRISEGDVLVLSGHRLRCSFTPPATTMHTTPAFEGAPSAAESPAVTGHFPPIPSDHAPRLEAAPMAAPEPHPEPEPEPEPEWPDSYEERMELRLHLLATEVAELRGMVRDLTASLDGLKVDALAQLIQSRLQKAKQP